MSTVRGGKVGEGKGEVRKVPKIPLFRLSLRPFFEDDKRYAHWSQEQIH